MLRFIKRLIGTVSEKKESSAGFERTPSEETEHRLLKKHGKNIQILGSGAYGIVYLLTKNNKKYVVKEMELTPDNKAITLREIAVLDKLYKRCGEYFVCLEHWKIKTESNKKYVLMIFNYLPNTEDLWDYEQRDLSIVEKNRIMI